MILHLVTDRRRLAGSVPLADARRCLIRQAEYAIDARIDCIVVRERDLEARELAELTADLVKRTRGTSTRVVVNDRVDVALASGADGAHLRADSIAPDLVRRMVPKGFLLGRSVHGAAEASMVHGADYLTAGTVWATESKPGDHPLLGSDGLAAIVSAVRIPVLAIGGVTLDRMRDLVAAGAAGAAAIGLFMASERAGCRAVQIAAMVEHARSRFDTSGSPS